MAPLQFDLQTGGFTRTYGDDAPLVAGVGIPFTETWTHADQANNLDADFDWVSLVAGWSIVSNAAELTNTGGASRIERLNVDLQTSDYRVRVPVATFDLGSTGTLVAGVCCRMPSSGASTFYTAFLFGQDGGPVSLNLSRWISGGAVPLGSVVLGTLALPADLAVSAKGNTITAWWDGRRRVQAIDGGIPSGAFAGVQGVAQFATTTARFTQATVEAVPAFTTTRRTRGLLPFTGVGR